jgi:hypothetical protein
MAGVVICGARHFETLKDPRVFAQIKVIGFGSGVGWPNGLGYSANALVC